MPPRPFYEIDSKTYLFGKSLAPTEVATRRNRMPEEQVRQWVLFELLSTYGYHINDIRIEVPSKMGRGYHPADIVIYSDHQPYIVIECKKIGSNEQDEAVKQVITYATGLKTQFAVYVDGQSWVVKRFLSGHWIDVNDVPPKTRLSSRNGFPVLLWFTSHIKPLLYWVYKTVPAKNAPKFFEHLDTFTFFIGFNYLRDVNQNLHFGINSVVKIFHQPLGEKDQTAFIVDDYKKKNFLIALSFFQKYLADIGSSGYLIESLDFDNRTFKDSVECLFVELNSSALNLSNTLSKEVVFLRFAVALLRHLGEVLKKSSYLSIEQSITNDLYSLINLILITEFGVEMPDNLDTDNIRELEGFSSEVWAERKN
ncbi:MAG: hypothetical protein HOP27_14445 [Anaerolineales bacterium]|nr:hypothetical protein [Anaerolineales bacterium]